MRFLFFSFFLLTGLFIHIASPQFVGTWVILGRINIIAVKAQYWLQADLNMYKPALQSNPTLRTPHYYGQFALSLGKESP